jgi:hypothetical protein
MVKLVARTLEMHENEPERDAFCVSGGRLSRKVVLTGR